MKWGEVSSCESTLARVSMKQRSETRPGREIVSEKALMGVITPRMTSMQVTHLSTVCIISSKKRDWL